MGELKWSKVMDSFVPMSKVLEEILHCGSVVLRVVSSCTFPDLRGRCCPMEKEFSDLWRWF